jgi:hypothetical protein
MASRVFTASAQVAGTLGAIYTCPSGRTAIVRSITVVNTDSVSRTVDLYRDSYRIIPKAMTLKAGESGTEDAVFTLQSGEAIKGIASTASVIDCTISGAEFW